MIENKIVMRGVVRARLGKGATFPALLTSSFEIQTQMSERERSTDGFWQGGLDGYGPSPSESLGSRRCSAHPYSKLLCSILLDIRNALLV